MKLSTIAHRGGAYPTRRRAVGVGLVLSALVVAGGCGSTGASEPAPQVDPKFASLSPAARSLLAGVADGQTGYRVKATIGMSMNANGTSFAIEPNLDQPMLTQETDAAGERHTIVDVTSLSSFGLGGSDQDTLAPRAESWNNDDELVAEVSGIPDMASEAGASADPAQQLLAPGRFKVDLQRVGGEAGSATGDRLLAALGQSMIDPNELMVQLGTTLDRATPVPGELNKQQVTTTLGELAESSGTDPLDNPMLDEALGTDESARADANKMLDAVKSIPVTMTFSTDPDGRLTELTTDIELSNVAQAIGGMAPADDQSAQDAANIAENMQLSMSYPLAIEYDDSIDVVVPSDVTDDRTDVFIEVLQAADESADDAVDAAANDAAAPELTVPDISMPESIPAATVPDATLPDAAPTTVG